MYGFLLIGESINMTIFKSLLLGLAIVLTQAVAATDSTKKAMQIMVPYTPGGFNDVMARELALNLSPMWNVPVHVDNRPGGNTLLANRLVANDPGNAQNILVTPMPFSVLPSVFKNQLQYDPVRDFTPLIWVGYTQNVLVVRKDLDVDSVPALIAYARRNPGKLNFGSTGIASSNHLSAELFKTMTDTEMVHVPYKGSAPAVAALMSGEIDLLFDNVPNVLQQIRADRIKALATTGSQRSAMLPNLPTIASAGVPGYEVLVWYGLQMHSGVPKNIVDSVNQDINQILKDPVIIQRFKDKGVTVTGGTPERFGNLIQQEIERWGRVVDRSGIKMQ